MPRQSDLPWLTIVPVAESRSSYNGLLVFLFIASSAWLTAFAIHRLASHALRRSDPWDCGFPDPTPLTQYSASSFAQPIRRVFANIGFSSRENAWTCRRPDPRGRRCSRWSCATWFGRALYLPIVRVVDVAAGLLNHLQFLTIRRYLALVFAALVVLLLALAVWS